MDHRLVEASEAEALDGALLGAFVADRALFPCNRYFCHVPVFTLMVGRHKTCPYAVGGYETLPLRCFGGCGCCRLCCRGGGFGFAGGAAGFGDSLLLFDFLDELSALGDLDFGESHLAEALESGLDDVDGVVAAARLGEDVSDACELDDGSDGASGYDAGAGRGWLEHDDGAAVLGYDVVRDGRALEGDFDHVASGLDGALADGVGHGVGLAHADADVSLFVTDDDDGVEAEVSSALDDLCDAGYSDDSFDEVLLVGVAIAVAVAVAVAIPVSVLLLLRSVVSSH